MRLLISLIALLLASPAFAAQPLRVCATVPDLGALAQAIGGDAVEVTVFARGTEDPHFIEARPSFVRQLAQADLYLQVGLELEEGWAPVLLRTCRNGAVQPGQPGHLDCSAAITPRDVPTGRIDRSHGHVHASGNPHYLLDPVNGLKVARLIRDRLSQLRPDQRQQFHANYDRFRSQLATALVGEQLAKLYDIEKLMTLADHDKLESFLASQGESALLGGWLAKAQPLRNAPVVVDHNMWHYFTHRFHLKPAASIEPKPGLPPTTRHLTKLIKQMEQQNVELILVSPYFDPRHGRLLAGQTGAQVAMLAHQVNAVEAADSYLSLFEHNISRLTELAR